MTIQWQGNRSSVFAEVGDYRLEADRFDGDWHWSVKFKGILTVTTYTHEHYKDTRAAAQRAAEKAMNEHINKSQTEK